MQQAPKEMVAAMWLITVVRLLHAVLADGLRQGQVLLPPGRLRRHDVPLQIREDTDLPPA